MNCIIRIFYYLISNFIITLSIMQHYIRFIEGKTYSPPQTEIVEFTQQGMLCQSPGDIEEPIPIFW